MEDVGVVQTVFAVLLLIGVASIPVALVLTYCKDGQWKGFEHD